MADETRNKIERSYNRAMDITETITRLFLMRSRRTIWNDLSFMLSRGQCRKRFMSATSELPA